MAAPEVHALAQEMAGKANVLKVDTGANPEVAARFGVQSIPNFVVLRDGRVVMQRAGLAPRLKCAAGLNPPGPASESRLFQKILR